MYAQRYAFGNTLGNEFQVNTYTTLNQEAPSIAMDGNGNFIIVWQSDNQDGHWQGIFGQLYDANGQPQGGEFQVNTHTNNDQASPSVIYNEHGIIVTWYSKDPNQDGNGYSVQAQKYNTIGIPIGGETLINTYTTDNQWLPVISSSTSKYIIAWSSHNQDGDNEGVFAQQFSYNPIGANLAYDANCLNVPIQFTDLSNINDNITSWSWNFGDGNTSTLQNPTHTYTSNGSYNVQLTIFYGSTSETTQQTIDIKNQLSLNVIEYSTFPNKSVYNVMETANVHHYFEVTDAGSNPIENVIIDYSINNGGNIGIYTSALSNIDGLLDLNIKLGGENPANTIDDWANVGTSTISFDNIQVTANPNYCTSPIILQNDFQNNPFSIIIEPLDVEQETFGLYSKAGIGANLCTGCLGVGPFGVGALDMGIGGETGLVFELGEVYGTSGLLEGYEVAVKNEIGIDINGQIGNLSFGPVSASLGSVAIDFKPSSYEKLYMDISSNQSVLVGLYYLFEVINVTNTPVFQSIKTALNQYLQDNNNASYVEDGKNFELKLTGTVGPSVGFAFGGNPDNIIEIDFLQASGNSGYELGARNTVFDSQSAFSTSYRQFSGFDFTLFSASASDLIGVDELFDPSFPIVARSVSFEAYYNSFSESLIGAEIELSNSAQVLVQGNSRNVNFSTSIEMGNDAIHFLKNQAPTLNNPVANYLIGRGNYNPLRPNNSDMISDMDNIIQFLGTNYQSSWPDDEIEISGNRGFETVYPLPVPLQLEIGLAIGVGYTFTTDLSIGGFINQDYPSFTKAYSKDVNKFLVSVDYPNDFTFIKPAYNPIDAWFANTTSAFFAELSNIQNSVSEWMNTASNSIVGGWNILYNDIRDVINNGRLINTNNPPPPNFANTFTDFSVLEIGYPTDTTVFQANTTTNLKHFFAFETTKGVADNLDTFLVISDIFFFEAITPTDTLMTSPNGDFYIKTKTGIEDLLFVGLDSNSTVELFHQYAGDSVWTSIAMGNDSINFNKTGIFVFGVRLDTDTISPSVSINLPSVIDTSSIISIYIDDSESGVKWSTVSISLNNQDVPYERIGFTNEILISLDSVIFDTSGTFLLSVQARDNASNFGYDVASLDISTSTNEIQVFDALLKLYPNPTSQYLNISYKLEQKGDITFEVYDLTGRLVQQENTEKLSSGVYHKTIVFDNLATNIYFLCLKVNGQVVETRKFIYRN